MDELEILSMRLYAINVNLFNDEEIDERTKNYLTDILSAMLVK